MKKKVGIVSKLSGGLYDTFRHYRTARNLLLTVNEKPVFYSVVRAKADVTKSEALIEGAKKALNQGAFSVMDKSDCAPSGSKHDYYSIGAYWWPNPDTDDGLPYVHRDCERNPATELYSEASKAFDKTSLQLLIDTVTALALFGAAKNQGDMRARAAILLKSWFVNTRTAMSPHLMYAQVHPGEAGNRGAPQGIIEARDLILLIDGILILKSYGDLSDHDLDVFRNWFRALLLWLETDVSGLKERSATNNHGTNYDLLAGSIARFVKDKKALTAILTRAEARATVQIWPNGKQPEELKRPLKFHYCAYNLQSWLQVMRLMQASGMNIETLYSLCLEAARDLWLMTETEKAEMKEEDFDLNRLVPILTALQRYKTETWLDDTLASRRFKKVPDVFHPYTGIPPYWRLSAG